MSFVPITQMANERKSQPATPLNDSLQQAEQVEGSDGQEIHDDYEGVDTGHDHDRVGGGAVLEHHLAGGALVEEAKTDRLLHGLHRPTLPAPQTDATDPVIGVLVKNQSRPIAGREDVRRKVDEVDLPPDAPALGDGFFVCEATYR